MKLTPTPIASCVVCVCDSDAAMEATVPEHVQPRKDDGQQGKDGDLSARDPGLPTPDDSAAALPEIAVDDVSIPGLLLSVCGSGPKCAPNLDQTTAKSLYQRFRTGITPTTTQMRTLGRSNVEVVEILSRAC